VKSAALALERILAKKDLAGHLKVRFLRAMNSAHAAGSLSLAE
jgi:hypothetical protein